MSEPPAEHPHVGILVAEHLVEADDTGVRLADYQLDLHRAAGAEPVLGAAIMSRPSPRPRVSSRTAK